MQKLSDIQIRAELDDLLARSFDGALSDEIVGRIIRGHIDRALEERRVRDIRKLNFGGDRRDHDRFARLLNGVSQERAAEPIAPLRLVK